MPHELLHVKTAHRVDYRWTLPAIHTPLTHPRPSIQCSMTLAWEEKWFSNGRYSGGLVAADFPEESVQDLALTLARRCAMRRVCVVGFGEGGHAL
jgi:hypothetical protein